MFPHRSIRQPKIKCAALVIAAFLGSNAFAVTQHHHRDTKGAFVTVALIDRLYELVDEVDSAPLEPPLPKARIQKRQRLYSMAESIALELNRNGKLNSLAESDVDDATINGHLDVIRPIFRSRCAKASLCVKQAN